MLAGAAGGRMRARAPPRPSPHAPAPATGQGDPRRGPSLFHASAALRRGHRHPGAARPSGTRGRRSELATRGTGGLDDPPTHASEALRQDETPDISESHLWGLYLAGGGRLDPPSGRRPHFAGACGPRAARAAGGDAGPERSEGNSEGPPADLACSVARVGESEGGARCAARVTRPEAAGLNKGEASCSDKRESSLPAGSPRSITASTQWERNQRNRAAARWAKQREASRSEQENRP